MKELKFLVVFSLLYSLAGCVSTYTLVEPGVNSYAGLSVETSQAWNLVPRQLSAASRSDSKTWTQDGVLLDRLMIIPAVQDGESIFVPLSKQVALPTFNPAMNPKEIEELTESSIVKFFGEGEVVVETASLRPHRFGQRRGFLFDIEMAVNDGPDYSGVAGAFVANDKLYLMIYLGAKPFYFDKHKDEALAIIRGSHLANDGLLKSS